MDDTASSLMIPLDPVPFGTKDGRMRPQSVPPSTFCVANDSSSHFKSAMDRRTMTIAVSSAVVVFVPSLA